MRIDRATPLLGGLSPSEFMRRHWQKKPLLVRQAIPAIRPPVNRSDLFKLVARHDVESRLVQRSERGWTLKRGPLARRAIPGVRTPRWTLLVQGLNLHVDAANELLERFRFVPDARLDDLMLSYATDAGGVGPHLDSYDVFLLQVQGVREWRIGRVAKPKPDASAPLKLLTNFVARQTFVLMPGDMLYLPPQWAHDGVALGECMTASIGFRAPLRRAVAAEILQRWLDAPCEDGDLAGEATRYRDRAQPALATPARMPSGLQQFAREAVQRELADSARTARALGEWLSEPDPSVVFERARPPRGGRGVCLDRRSKMLYDERHIFINGESYRAGGADATRLRRLADRHALSAGEVASLGVQARSILEQWARSGWLHSTDH